MSKKVFENASERIPIWLLDAIIIIGISAMAILIPMMSEIGKERGREVVAFEDGEEVLDGDSEVTPLEK